MGFGKFTYEFIDKSMWTHACRAGRHNTKTNHGKIKCKGKDGLCTCPCHVTLRGKGI